MCVYLNCFINVGRNVDSVVYNCFLGWIWFSYLFIMNGLIRGVLYIMYDVVLLVIICIDISYDMNNFWKYVKW